MSREYSKIFCLQTYHSGRKSSKSREYSKTFWPAKLSQPQIINISGIFKDFFACRIVLAANHHYPGTIQRIFCLQNYLSRKSSKSREYSKTFSPAKLSQPPVIIILALFKEFFACKIVLAANHQYPGNIHRLFCLQNYLSRKSSKSWKYSKSFACKIVLAANHQYPDKFQRVFRLQNCLSCKSSISWQYSKTFSPANLSQPQITKILGIFKDFFACKFILAANHQNSWKIQRIFGLQNCLSRQSSKSREYSKAFSPAKLSQPPIITILRIFKDFLACKTVLAANHQNPGNIQRLFRLQNCLSRQSSIS